MDSSYPRASDLLAETKANRELMIHAFQSKYLGITPELIQRHFSNDPIYKTWHNSLVQSHHAYKMRVAEWRSKNPEAAAAMDNARKERSLARMERKARCAVAREAEREYDLKHAARVASRELRNRKKKN